MNVGKWNSVAVNLAADFAALFPGIDVRDLSLVDLNINAVSTGGIATGYFDYLRFSRQSSGQMPLQTQADLEADCAEQYPNVTQRQGLEVSMGSPHLNWFGGISLPDHSGISGTFEDFLQHSLVPFTQDRDGLVSYNHLYGTGSRFSLDQPTQDELLRQTASRMVSNDALGSAILEVGYPLRGGVDLRHHIELWDVCSRNALFLTATESTMRTTGPTGRCSTTTGRLQRGPRGRTRPASCKHCDPDERGSGLSPGFAEPSTS